MYDDHPTTAHFSYGFNLFKFLNLAFFCKHITRGIATKFRLGGGGGADFTGRTGSGESKLSTPKFRFLLGFRQLYFRNIGNSKKWETSEKIL